MSGILTALSAPENQQQLFAAEMTIEEALDELFRRHGGRRDGGRRILDYREYVRLRVEVRRRGSETWEEARGNQLSTGEAIGVGAAIMMVVLTAWERDASLLRARREVGTLRFLFLDEATRLSLDNLEVLFGLCAALELQLLIAAPEVATSSGNTTYLLQRSVDSAGREAVVVSGRRAIRGGA
jgi:chromosome partition protein MukB